MGLIFLLYLSGALAVSFMCSILEAILLSTPVSFITMKERSGVKNAALFKKLKTNIDRPISAILSLNTIAHTVGAAGVGAEAVKLFGEAYFGIISAILTILILVLSEILPKTVGARYWRTLAMGAAPLIEGLIYITYPLVALSDLITRMFSSGRNDVSVSREEVSAMVSVGAEEGVIETKENRIIQNLFRFENIRAGEIMTPGTVSVCACRDMTLSEFCREAAYRNFSRIPLYGSQREYIIGYVLRRTILEKLSEGCRDMRLAEISRPVLSFTEQESVSSVWESMQERREQIAVIIDSYGGFRGIVTMEDVIETLFGFEIMDEKDTVPDMQILAKERWERATAETGPTVGSAMPR